MSEATHNGIPDSFWRPVPCGHPSDPVAAIASDGHAVCHCGDGLIPALGLPVEGAPGPVVQCNGCGCHVAIPQRGDSLAMLEKTVVEKSSPSWFTDVVTFALAASETEKREAEMVELLRLWFERWRGFVVGTPDNMHLRTRAILDEHGVELAEIRIQR